MDPLGQLLFEQSGVISRRQLLELGITDSGIARMLRRRDLVRLHRGVFVDHTGEPTWLQRAWGAVLFSSPAALSHESALRVADGPGGPDQGPIHVAVDPSRSLVAPPGVRMHRNLTDDRRVQWNLGPPRVRYDEAALDVAASRSAGLPAVAVLTKAVQGRRTSARRLLAALESRERIANREFLAGVLADIAEGTCSVLEHAYLHRVERGHRLPRARRQTKADGRVGRIYRDASYDGLEVELDGRLVHSSPEQRDSDYDRDLLTLAGGRVTARVSYGQVFDRPCWTAGQVERLLRDRGWGGHARCCGPDCRLRG